MYMTKRPCIVLTLDTSTTERGGIRLPTIEQKSAYNYAVETAGGLPLWVAPTSSHQLIEQILTLADGIVVTGGDFDISPQIYGASPTGARNLNPTRTHFESMLVKAAINHQIPVLGICGGMQLLNVITGGTLIQDIRHHVLGAFEHEQPTSPTETWHELSVVPDGWLSDLISGATLPIRVNSTHHQAVATIGHGWEATAFAPDGVIEAIAHRSGRYIGVQWHPELIPHVPMGSRIYQHFIATCCQTQSSPTHQR